MKTACIVLFLLGLVFMLGMAGKPAKAGEPSKGGKRSKAGESSKTPKPSVSKIDPEIEESLKLKGTATVIVSFKHSNLDQVRQTFDKKYKSEKRSVRLDGFYKLSIANTDKTQSALIASLNVAKKGEKKSSLHIEQLWATNELLLVGASKKIIDLLEKSPDVLRVEPDRIIQLHGNALPKDGNTNNAQTEAVQTPPPCFPMGPPQWNIRMTQAPQVRDGTGRTATGEGIVVAITDSGVDRNHVALRRNFRQMHGWWDPLTTIEDPRNAGTEHPFDASGHGTHVAGIAVGTEGGIGMAPGALWIACRACDHLNRCHTSALKWCGGWTLCPDRPRNPDVTEELRHAQRCQSAPHISVNSWGTAHSASRSYYDMILWAYERVGIFSVFAIGNQGLENRCGGPDYPGDSPLTMGVGATNADNYVSQMSSSGPSLTSLQNFWAHQPPRRQQQQQQQAEECQCGSHIKPDVSAPGENICSAAHNNPNSYVLMTGTSMAAPHVAGLAAILLGYNQIRHRRELTWQQVYDCITQGGVPTRARERSCAGIPETEFPNHFAGRGRIDAVESFVLCGGDRPVEMNK